MKRPSESVSMVIAVWAISAGLRLQIGKIPFISCIFSVCAATKVRVEARSKP